MRRFVVYKIGSNGWIVRDQHSWVGPYGDLRSVSRVYAHVDDAQAVADWLTDRAAGYVPRAHNLITNTGITL